MILVRPSHPAPLLDEPKPIVSGSLASTKATEKAWSATDEIALCAVPTVFTT